MRKASLDRPWVPSEHVYTLQSLVMPGFNLKICRTDGVQAPPPQDDLILMAHHPFKKHEVTHLRNHGACNAITTYDVTVETMPCIPEMPEAVAKDLA